MALLPAMPIIVALLLFFGYQSLPSPHLPKSQVLTVRAKSLPAQTGKLAIALDGQKNFTRVYQAIILLFQAQMPLQHERCYLI